MFIGVVEFTETRSQGGFLHPVSAYFVLGKLQETAWYLGRNACWVRSRPAGRLFSSSGFPTRVDAVTVMCQRPFVAPHCVIHTYHSREQVQLWYVTAEMDHETVFLTRGCWSSVIHRDYRSRAEAEEELRRVGPPAYDQYGLLAYTERRARGERNRSGE